MKNMKKFRVWSEEENKMYYHDTKNNDLASNFLGQILKISYAGDRCGEPLFVFEILDDSFKKLQCLGIKDKNERLIYNGDIVKEREYEKTNIKVLEPIRESVKYVLKRRVGIQDISRDNLFKCPWELKNNR